MGSERMRRVDEAVRQVLADALAHELKDPRIGFVRVFVSVLGEAEQRDATLDGLRSAHGHLQRRIARELKLKHTPTLEFSYDDTTDRAMRVGELIERERHGGDRDGEQP
jgi:ribosome-binding factor A